MKRSLFLLPAVALAIFGALLALNVVNFEDGLAGETSRIDRWVMIFCFAGVAGCIGLATGDSSPKADEEVLSGRAAAARKLGEGRPDPAELPSKPGSLLKKPVIIAAEHVAAEPEVAAIDVALVEESAPEIASEPAPTDALVATGQPTLDPVDAELQSLIDDDQMEEINELVAAAEAEAEADATEAVVPGSDSVEPLSRLELRLADYNDEDLKRVVKESESVVIAEMVRTGQLTSEGALTEKDIASMIFLAYTSDEMLTELRLRKTLDQGARGQAGLEASTGSDFAPLKNIE